MDITKATVLTSAPYEHKAFRNFKVGDFLVADSSDTPRYDGHSRYTAGVKVDDHSIRFFHPNGDGTCPVVGPDTDYLVPKTVAVTVSLV